MTDSINMDIQSTFALVLEEENETLTKAFDALYPTKIYANLRRQHENAPHNWNLLYVAYHHFFFYKTAMKRIHAYIKAYESKWGVTATLQESKIDLWLLLFARLDLLEQHITTPEYFLWRTAAALGHWADDKTGGISPNQHVESSLTVHLNNLLWRANPILWSVADMKSPT